MVKIAWLMGLGGQARGIICEKRRVPHGGLSGAEVSDGRGVLRSLAGLRSE